MTEQTEPTNEPSQALTVPVQSADKEYDRFARLGTWLAAAEGSNDPRGKDGMAAAARVAIAVESGWPWRAAFEIALVHNKPHISSALLRALAEAEGYRVLKISGDETSCTAAVMDRNGHELGQATFTLEQAKRAGLVKDKSAWVTYPERMLWARASGFAVMDAVPHVALGFSALETEDIITLHPGDVTEVDETGAEPGDDTAGT